MVNPKDKGSEYERKIAKILSKQFKDYLKVDAAFYRDETSGAWFASGRCTMAKKRRPCFASCIGTACSEL